MANYISNKEFYNLLVDYKNKCKEATVENYGIVPVHLPKIPDDIARCFVLIATRLASKANFSGYTYKDEMIGDGIENCIIACRKFDPEKSNNPFAYFTQIIWFAFLRRINTEKKQTYVKYKALESAMLEELLNDEEEVGQYENFNLENEKMIPIIKKFERKPKVPKKKTSLNKFIDKGI